MEPATVVLYPSPGIGHLVSTVELAKLICTHHPSLSLVVLITPSPLETGVTGNYIKTVSTTTPSITFHHLPTITFPPDLSSEFLDLAFGIPQLYNPVVHDTLLAISHKSTVKAVILDFFSDAAFQVCKTLSLPTYYFNTSSTSALCVLLYLSTIHNTTSDNIKDLNIHFPVPGVPPIHASDMPHSLFDRESTSYKNFMNIAVNLSKSSGIITNSFTGLEERAAEAVRDGKCIPDGPTPPVYLIGPLIATQEISIENECFKWLDSQPSKSVVFLCFGSLGVLKKDQLKEIAIGLEKSEQRFLWVVRNSPPDDANGSGSGGKDVGLDDFLPEGFLGRCVGVGKGLVLRNWAPQPAILSHDSVGGFVSHCGWNSTLEAVVAGVPMVAWPLYAEQKMNRVFLVEEMKVAMAVEMSADGFVTAEGVEEKVRELMEGEEGRVVRERMLEMSGRAKAAVADGGSSRVEFFKLTQSWMDPHVSVDV